NKVRCKCFFFFQAEDGIRDFHVTGVQRVLFRSWRDGCLPSVRRRRRRFAGQSPSCRKSKRPPTGTIGGLLFPWCGGSGCRTSRPGKDRAVETGGGSGGSVAAGGHRWWVWWRWKPVVGPVDGRWTAVAGVAAVAAGRR